MEIALPLEKMTVQEKLQAMEMLWTDLSRNEENVESPDWHGIVLQERVDRVKDGKEAFLPWAKAKRLLRNQLNRARHDGVHC